jgi:hypothetical protein
MDEEDPAPMNQLDNDEEELKELEKLENGGHSDESNDELKELEALDDEHPKQKHKEVDPKQRLQEIDQLMEKCKSSVKTADKQQIEQLKEEYINLNKEKTLIISKHPELKPAQPKIDKKAIALKKMAVELILPEKKSYKSFNDEDAEEILHNPTFMLALSVIENEQEVLKKLGKHEYIEIKLEALSTNKMMLESKVGNGIITQEQYLDDVKRQLEFETNLLKQATECEAIGKHLARIKQRISLLNAELSDSSSEQPIHEQPAQKQEPITEAKESPPKKLETALKDAPIKKDPIVFTKEENKETNTGDEPMHIHDKLPIQEEVKIAKSEYNTPDPPPIDFSSSIIIKKDEIDFTKVDKEQYEKINSRLSEYRSAAEYYMNYSLKERAESMILVAKKLKQVLDVIKGGNKIDMLRAEPPLTPDIFIGMTAQSKAESSNINRNQPIHYCISPTGRNVQ